MITEQMVSFCKRLQFYLLQTWMFYSPCRWWTLFSVGIISIIFFYFYFSAPVHNEFPYSPVEQTTPKAVRKTLGNPREDWSSYQYAIILDCGSSGSRVFIYFWPEHSGIRGELLNINQLLKSDGSPAVMKVEPGLSAFPSEPSKATDQVVKLLNFAKAYIPVQCHRDTFVYIMATAGMRMLQDVEQESILADIRSNVPIQTPFKLSTAEVITGKMEGIYAWIAINAALGKLGNKAMNSETVGILDMGGGSIQIAFELDQTDHPPQDVMSSFSLGPSDQDKSLNYRLYVATYLGLGANSAIKAHLDALATDKYTKSNELLHFSNTPSADQHGTVSNAVVDPCYPAGYSTAVNVSLPDKSQDSSQTVILNGSGDFPKCEKRLENLLASISTETSRVMASCGLFCSPLSGLNPSVAYASRPPNSMNRKKFYGFSEFWYSMEDILHLGGQYDAETFHKKASDFCANEWHMLVEYYSRPQFATADYARFTTQCFKSAWVSVMLHSGFLFPKNSDNFASVQKINGSEVHWTLGALLYKMRSLPLRRIQMVESSGILRHNVKNSASGPNVYTANSSSFSPYFIPYLPQVTIFFCGIIVLLAIAYYCHKLSTPRFFGNRIFQNSKFDTSQVDLRRQDSDEFSMISLNTSWPHKVSEATQTPFARESNIVVGPKNRMMTSQSVGSRMHHLA